MKKLTINSYKVTEQIILNQLVFLSMRGILSTFFDELVGVILVILKKKKSEYT